MSGLEPAGPSQPTKQDAYETEGNRATQEPSERAAAQASRHEDSGAANQRIPTKQSSIGEAKPSSLGHGVQGAGPGEEEYDRTEEDVGRQNELDGEQMATPGEGRVAAAIEGRTRAGASGEQEDLASDLDRKKAEQAPYREAIQDQRKQDVDVGGVLGQRCGPANPVGKNDYPNTSD
jgi:hypothetical protein